MIHFVVGTRAQLFKLAPVMLECERRQLAWRWVYTAQHRETIQESLETFGLPPPAYVVVRWNTEAKSFGRMLGWFARMLLALGRSRRILAGRTGRQHVVVTHGDTFTTWLGALVGKLTRTPVLHVESGLRSFNLRNPFPEEINRLITFRLADFYACPGPVAVANLRRHRGEKLDIGANTQADTLRFGLDRVGDAAIDLPDEKYVVVTIHRYENVFDQERLGRIATELETIAPRFRVLFIRHPVTDVQLEKTGIGARLEPNPRIELLPRLEYLPFLKLVLGAEFVISDGGGNQEELSYLGIPVLIARDETERPEGLGENAVISKLDPRVIREFVEEYESYRRPQRLPEASPSATIVDFLEARGFGAA